MMFASLLSNPFVERVGWLLVHSLWQFALIALVAAAGVRMMRRSSSAARYGVLVLAMLAMTVAPLATWFLLPSEASRATVATENHRPLPQAATQLISAAEAVESVQTDQIARATEPPTTISAAEGPFGTTIRSYLSTVTATVQPWLTTAVFCWCVGVLLFSLRPLLSLYVVRRLRRVGLSDVPAAVHAQLSEIAVRLKVRPAVQIFQSSLVNMPIALGHFRPMILLPASVVTGLPTSQLEAIIAHELTHIRRHDYLVNLFQTMVESIAFYHPAVWWLSARIRAERENCCDDLAVRTLDNRVEYGRALVAVAQLHGGQTSLALGAGDSSLLARIRRLTGRQQQENRSRSPLAAAVLNSALLLVLVVLSVNWAAAQTETGGGELNGPNSIEFGPPSAGLQCRLVAVETTADDEKPDPTNVAGQFAKDDDLTFTVELKNVSDKPVTLLGVRYGENYPTAKGKLNTAFYGPHLFEFEFTDSNGNPIARAKRQFEDDSLALDGTSTHQLAPGKSLTILLRPGHFRSPMEYELPAGHYHAKVRYRGPSEKLIERIKKHWPDKPHVAAWRGQVTSNSVEFAIAQDLTAKKDQELSWGPVVDGLQAAIEFQVPDYVQEDPTDLPGIPLKTKTSVFFHVRNASDRPITFASETARQGDSIHVTDATGEKVDVRSTWYSGWPIDVRWVLQPGDVARLYLLTPSVASIDKPGMYTVRYTLRFNSRQKKDKDGNVIFPLAADYKSELDTGEALLFFRERTPEDDERAKPPTFTGKVRFVDDQGKTIDAGNFTFSGEIKREDREDIPLRAGAIEIPECTAKPARIVVRAPGYEEAVFYDVKFKPNETTTLKLKRAAPSTFRLVSSVDGKPVPGARIRYFNKTSAKASSGPFPMKGIEGPVWANSQSDGRVVLDSLQRVNPIYEKLGDAVYYFYIEPASPDLAPRFVGPVKAGQDLGEIAVGPFLEVRGEVQGTAEELNRFAAEWDQPLELTTDNPDATWIYAVSKRLKTKREGNKLTFHLKGLRPGKIRFISNFGPRPHSVSHTYGRRDPKGSDVVVQLDLDQSYIGLVLTSQDGKKPKDDRESGNEQPQKTNGNDKADSSGTLKIGLFDSFDCKIVDADTGDPVPGEVATIHFRFRQKADKPEEGEAVGNLIWPRSGSDFGFGIPDSVMKRSDLEDLVLHWAVAHPQYETRVEIVPLKPILLDNPKSARDRFRVIRLRPKMVDLKKTLDRRVSLEAKNKKLLHILSELEEKYDVPITMDLKKLNALNVSMHTEFTLTVASVPLRDLFDRLVTAAGATMKVSPSGITIPGDSTRIIVHYDMPGEEENARIYVQHIGGRDEIGTEQEGLSKWNPLKNGDTLDLTELDAGDYQVARMKAVDVAQAGRGRMSQVLFLDRRRFALQPGQVKTIRFTRTAARPVTGKVLRLPETKLETALVTICSENADETPTDDLDVVLYDAFGCDADGGFTTGPLSPGNYVAVVQAYEPRTQQQLNVSGVPTPRFTGLKKFTVPANGKVPTIEVPLRDNRPQ